MHKLKTSAFITNTRLFCFICLSVFLSIIIIIAVSLKTFERDFIETTTSELEHISAGITSTLAAWGNVLKGSTQLIAERPDVIAALKKQDIDVMNKLANSFYDMLDISGAIFTDANGIVLASSDPAIQVGADYSGLEAVDNALHHINSMCYGPIGSLRYSEIYACPIKNRNGAIIGTIILTYNLTGDSFVQLIHGYGIDCTIFSKNERVASTIPNDIGTKINNAEIENTVLAKGQVFVGRVQVKNIDFYSVYSPLKNEDGTVVGMFFVAREVKAIKMVTASILRIIIPFCIIISIGLITAITYWLGINHRKLKLETAMLEKQVNWDPLTNANTRVFGITELEHFFSNFRRGFKSPAIILFDVDNFKSINDTYGHEAGDQVLKNIVSTIMANCRTSDKIIRWGGDEFIGIFEGMQVDDCRMFTQKLLQAVSEAPMMLQEHEVHVTISIGFSYFLEEDSTYKTVLSRADKALYQAKKHGKNTAAFEDSCN